MLGSNFVIFKEFKTVKLLEENYRDAISGIYQQKPQDSQSVSLCLDIRVKPCSLALFQYRNQFNVNKVVETGYGGAACDPGGCKRIRNSRPAWETGDPGSAGKGDFSQVMVVV